MSLNTSYSQARANLASLLETVTSDREIVIIERRRREDVAMVAASELSSLLETAHLLRSPANAERPLDEALDGKGQKMTAEKLRKRLTQLTKKACQLSGNTLPTSVNRCLASAYKRLRLL